MSNVTGALQSIATGTAGLTVIALLAIVLGIVRGTVRHVGVRHIRHLVIAGIVLHLGHFTEELATGFHQLYPALFELSPWPAFFFIGFNLVWLLLWIISIKYVATRCLATAAIWFLALASIANGIFHPLLAVFNSGYFPGLYTSPLVGILGGMLARQLSLHTSRS